MLSASARLVNGIYDLRFTNYDLGFGIWDLGGIRDSGDDGRFFCLPADRWAYFLLGGVGEVYISF